MNEGLSKCQICPIGKSEVDGVCNDCPSGKTTPTNTSYGPLNTTCADCTAGYYNNKTASICLECPVGLAHREFGATSKAVCKVCAAGTFYPSIDAFECSNCPSGQFKSDGMHVCANCTIGSHGNDASGRSTPCISCGVEKSTLAAGAPGNASCHDCKSTEYQENENGGPCLDLSRYTCPLDKSLPRDCPCVNQILPLAFTWEVKLLTHCSGQGLQDDSGSVIHLDTLTAAKAACVANPKCRSIYSSGACPVDTPDLIRSGGFQLCSIEFDTYYRSSSSCIVEKQAPMTDFPKPLSEYQKCNLGEFCINADSSVSASPGTCAAYPVCDEETLASEKCECGTTLTGQTNYCETNSTW